MQLGRVQQSPRRIELWFDDPSLRGVVMLGRYNYTRAQADGLLPHSHADTMEICFLAKGKQVYRVDDRDFALTGGDVFVTFPDERHSTGGRPEEKGVLYWLQLRVPRKRERFLSLSGRDAHTFLGQLLSLKSRHFRGVWTMKTALDDIIDSFQQEHFPLKKVVITHRLMDFLLRVIERAQTGATATASPAISNTLQYIDDHLCEPIAIPDLAARAGLSPSRFKIRFKDEVGIPPAEFVLRRKIERSKQVLQEGRSNVTDVAFSLGFSSSQYFATVFKRYTGRPPKEFIGTGQRAVRRERRQRS